MTNHPYLSIPPVDIHIDHAHRLGPHEWWRHALGNGGINHLPLPSHIVQAVRQLQPRLIRIFIQQYFDVYDADGAFHWSRLDAYMDALHQTGAKVVAAICIKPPALFPTIDHAIWRPNNVDEWQRIIRAMVQRYSIEREIVTYWEVGNETDIGEMGGSPFLIADPRAYAEFYEMTIAPIVDLAPHVRVGGPASCWIENEPLPGLIRHCRATGARLDFISWHLYSDDPARHAFGVERALQLLADYPEPRPEMLITEWSTSFEVMNPAFDPATSRAFRYVSVQDMAFEPARAASVAASIIAMTNAGLDWSFYYHIQDQTFFAGAFRSFFSAESSEHMHEHWNESPHRFGLFGVGGEVRPQYFVYRMLQQLGEERIAAHSASPHVRVLSARSAGRVGTLLVNYDTQQQADGVAVLRFEQLAPGVRRLRTYRLDGQRRWRDDPPELLPLEDRIVDAPASFRCQVFLPANSVALLCLDSIADPTVETP